MKKPKLLLAVILLATVAATPFLHVYSSTLTITVFTDKPSYVIHETITVYGNLTYDGSPVQDWPVALEVQDPYNTPVVTRTLQTDTNGSYNLSFKLPPDAKLGTYTAYASSSYKGETAKNSTTFELIEAICDIAITNITFSKQIPRINETIYIYVTVENQGSLTETFDVSVNYTRTIDPLIGTQTITLAPGESKTLNFTWTPTTSGRHQIKAYTSTIPNDTNPSDNTKTTYIYVTSGFRGGVGGGRWVICLY